MTTLQQIRATRPEPCWTCFLVEFGGMLEKHRRIEDPIEWTVQPCDWRHGVRKCIYCSDHSKECTRVPALLEGNFKDLIDTIDCLRSLTSAPGGSPTGYALGTTAQTNVIKSLMKLAIGFERVVNTHKEEHKIRTGTQQALESNLEKYQLELYERRRDPITRALQRYTYPDDGLLRLTRDDREFYIWSSHVYKFYDDLVSGLELGLVPEEVISIIVTNIPIVRPGASNHVPNAVSRISTLLSQVGSHP